MKNLTGPTKKTLIYTLHLSWIFALMLILLGPASAGHAAIPMAQGEFPDGAIIVNSTEDIKKNDNQCTLREAIIAANSDKRSGSRLDDDPLKGECPAGNGGDTIILAAPPNEPDVDPYITRYTLELSDNGNEDSSNTGDLDISTDMAIIGAGSGQTIIDANGISDRAFHILSGNVAISDVTITRSEAPEPEDEPFNGDGAGIFNSGTLTLYRVTVKATRATGNGGGIYNDGVLTAFDSTVSNNSAGVNSGGNGGGIANASSGSIQLNNTTISGNFAPYGGGGIFNEGLLSLHNATISFNQANLIGSGIMSSTAEDPTTAVESGAVNIRNTIVANNPPYDPNNPDAPTDDCAGTLYSLGYNLIQEQLVLVPDGNQLKSNDCTLINNLNGIITGQDPSLFPTLQANGGQTLNHALEANSPAIDQGDPAGCFGSEGPLEFDQRGAPRTTDGNADGSARCDIGAFEADGAVGGGPVEEGVLVLIRAFEDSQNGNSPTVHGLVNSAPDTSLLDLDLKLFANDVCDPANPGTELTYDIVPINPTPGNETATDENGYFSVNNVKVNDVPITSPTFITGTAIDANGVSLQSNCVPYGDRNDDWPNAFLLNPNPEDYRDIHYIDGPGQSRWYKFKVEPTRDLTVILSGAGGADDSLPADYELTLYKDLQAAFDSIVNPDLNLLSAQYAGGSYSGGSYSGGSYSGGSYSGGSYSGGSYSGGSYSGGSYSGGSYSGGSYSGGSYSGGSYSGGSYSGGSYSGGSYSGGSYSGGSYSGGSYSDASLSGGSYSEAHSDAQLRSLLAVSSIGGTAPETIFLNTWNSEEYYYVRVRSSNGEFSVTDPFRIWVKLEPSTDCGNEVFDDLPATSLSAGANNHKTLILTDQTRMQDYNEIEANLISLAQPEAGVIIDVSEDDRVSEANRRADLYPECPYAKNLVAQSIKNIVDDYKDKNPLEYLVIVGNDAIIPFTRHPDFAALAKESQYVPPMNDNSPSQAALRLGFFLSDDDYVAKQAVPLGNSTFPIVDPGFAVGRLVESAADINAVIAAYLTPGFDGVVKKSTGESWSTLVTGYDFLDDASQAIRNELNAATTNFNSASELITSADVPPTDPSAWTASDLRTELLQSGHRDVVFLAGHFTGYSALAADYTTEMFAAELQDPALPSDLFSNTLIFSIGCHSGYNIVDQDGIDGVTPQPDWASAFASQGATLVAGTGYQYGETLTKEYSERLYIEFSKYLRVNTGPVSVGHALNQAKLAYITQVPSIRGTHEKSLLQSTVFGLPMLSFNLPGRYTPPGDSSVITSLLKDYSEFPETPGFVTGLQYFDLTVNSPLTKNDVPLTDIDTKVVLPAEFLSGSDGEVTNPTEPFLPLEVRNVTAEDSEGNIIPLRGVGFWEGDYRDVFNMLPVTGAPTTEAVALHLSWQTPYLYPPRMDNSNYLGSLIDGQQRILFTPAQHIQGQTETVVGNNGVTTDVRKSHRREFNNATYRLFYNSDITTFDCNNIVPTPSACVDGDPTNDPEPHTPALSSGPTIVNVSATPDSDSMTFSTLVVGDPAAGMQLVWVTLTRAMADPNSGTSEGKWRSFPLIQQENTKIWEETLTLSDINTLLELPDNTIDSPDDIRYMVQAVNAYGLVSQALNKGNFFTPGVDTVSTEDTVLTFETPENDASGLFDTLLNVSAFLKTPGGQPIANQTIEFKLGPGLSALGTTDASGRATATMTLNSLPDETLNGFPPNSNNPNDIDVQKLYASFAGNAPYKSSSAIQDFTILKQQPTLTIQTPEQNTAFIGQNSGVVATLLDEFGEPLNEQSVVFMLTDPSGLNDPVAVSRITRLFGEASLGAVMLPPGPYVITAHFGQDFENDPNLSSFGDLTSDAYEPVTVSTGEINFITLQCEVDAIIPELTDPTNPNQDPPPSIWPPNNEFWTVDLVVNDSSLPSNLGIVITSIFQDEEVGQNGPDGQFISAEDTDSVLLRAERDGNGDGRVYYINYVFTNGQGVDFCEGTEVIEVVPHDQSGNSDLIGGGQLHDSTEGPKNEPPVAVDDNAETLEDFAVDIDVLANDTDPNNKDTLTVIQVNNPANGTATLNLDNTITYSPTLNFNGIDSFTYLASDGALASNVATVTITILPVNDPPWANDDSSSTGSDTPVDIDVTSNDVDVDGTVDKTSVTVGNGLKEPDYGSVTVIEGPVDLVRYTPGDPPADDTFEYQVCDDQGACSSATVSVTVTAGNNPPQAVPDSDSTDEDVAVSIDVVINDSDADGDLDPATVNIVLAPTNGTVVVVLDENGVGTGEVLYTPNENFNGSDSFAYTVNDSEGLTSNVATVSITIASVIDFPVANDDEATIPEGGENVTIDVVANDTGGEGILDPTTATVVSGPSNGLVNNNGDGTFTYTPNENFSGSDSFTYTVDDDTDLTSNEGTVTVTVIDTTNEPPVAISDTFSGPKGNPIPGMDVINTPNPDIDNTSQCDHDFDQDSPFPDCSATGLFVIEVTQGTRGAVTLEDDGTLTYDPNSNFKGDDSFTYTISDGKGGTAVGTVTIIME